MEVKLRDMVEILAGFQLRQKLEKTNIGAYRLIQPKDIDRYTHELDSSNLFFTDMRNPERYFVGKGDVLLQARGDSYPPTLIRTQLDKTAVSSQYYILRIKSKIVLPEYLAFYLSLEHVQKCLKGLARGTNIKMLVKDSVENFILEIPPIRKQKTFVELYELVKKEKKLMGELIAKRTKLLSALCEDEK